MYSSLLIKLRAKVGGDEVLIAAKGAHAVPAEAAKLCGSQVWGRASCGVEVD